MSKKKRKRNEHKHEDFIFIGINGTTGKFQKLKNQDKSNEDFLSFLKCLDGRAEQSSIPVEKGSGKYPYVNFKKNIADDFKQQGGGDRSTSDATLTISSHHPLMIEHWCSKRISNRDNWYMHLLIPEQYRSTKVHENR